MTNTTPQLRPDYTGKMVTRHIKMVDSGDSKKSFPAPSSISDAKQITSQAAKALLVRDEIIAVFPPFKREQLHRLVTRREMYICGTELLDAVGDREGDDLKNWADTIDRTYDVADDTLNQAPKDIVEMRSNAIALLSGIHESGIVMNVEQETALVEVVCRIWMDNAMDDDSGYIDEVFPDRAIPPNKSFIDKAVMRNDLAQYVVEHHEQSDAIVRVVLERRISDPRIISELLDNGGSPSLIDGIL